MYIYGGQLKIVNFLSEKHISSDKIFVNKFKFCGHEIHIKIAIVPFLAPSYNTCMRPIKF